MKKKLKRIFEELNQRIDSLNEEIREHGGNRISKAEIKLLGQISLLSNEKVSMHLSLAQTADMDALLQTTSAVIQELSAILRKHGLIYDEDSKLIWQPPGTQFEIVFDFKNLLVLRMDPESALVSKAVKAPQKNKQLVRQAIASNKFPSLVDRILRHGGDLEYFAKD